MDGDKGRPLNITLQNKGDGTEMPYYEIYRPFGNESLKPKSDDV